MNGNRHARPTPPLALPLAARPRFAVWWQRWQRRRLDRRIVVLQRLLADEFASAETAALHDELEALWRRRDAIDAWLTQRR